MNPGEIYMGSFPFGGRLGTKIRPVLLLTGPLGSVPEVLVAYFTSKTPGTLLPTDILIDPAKPDRRGTNLKTRSLLRLHKLATIHQSNLLRYLGKVSAATQTEVETKLRLLLKL
jgi:mRNA-degrading endonuclease toxin of MazEF toxin-antitoxin module